MALTQSRSDVTAAPSARADDPRPSGFAGVLGSGDHKVVGRLFIATSLLFLLIAEVLGELVNWDQVSPGSHKLFKGIDPNAFVTSHLIGVVFAGLIPLFLGVALVVVPLQVGSRAIAFPRAAALGFWAWLTGVILLGIAYGIHGGPGGSRPSGVDLWALAFIMLIAGLLLASVCVITTVFTLRAPGMRLTRVPLFSWGMVVSASIWLLSLPVLAAVLLIIYVDHHNAGIFLGNDASGATFNQVIWAFRQPQIYAFVAPVLGILGDIVPTFARARDEYRHQVAQTFIGMFAVLGFGAFTITSFNSGPRAVLVQTPLHNPVVIVMSLLIILPVLGLAGLWADSFRRGHAAGAKPIKGSPLAFVGVTLALLLLGVLTGALIPIQRLKLNGTLFSDGHFEVVMGAGVTGALAALYYWSSKIIGRRVLDVGGLGVATLALFGTLALAAGNMLPGAFGKGAAKVEGTETYNWITVLGGGLVVLAVALAIVNLLAGLRGDSVPADPWEGGLTLEWATDSPPAYDNFVEVPPVGSEAPLLDLRSPEVAG